MICIFYNLIYLQDKIRIKIQNKQVYLYWTFYLLFCIIYALSFYNNITLSHWRAKNLIVQRHQQWHVFKTLNFKKSLHGHAQL